VAAVTTRPELEQLAAALRAGALPPCAELVRRSPVRIAALAGDIFLKVYPRRPRSARREARNLQRAAADGLPVPAVLDWGDGWIAMRRLAQLQPATRDDLAQILELTARMHAAGWVHGDLHLGNFARAGGTLYLLDLQRARRWPRALGGGGAPAPLRARDLGFLAFSLGEPLPAELAGVRRWRERRAHTHWRSRTRRCLRESSGFVAWTLGGERGFRVRAADEARLRAALQQVGSAQQLKQSERSRLYRSGGWILKQHASARRARGGWGGGGALEARGIATARAVAWLGRWLIMEDAGTTLAEWVDKQFETAPVPTREEMARELGGLLARLHRRGIYHADLKANNVAWSPGAPPRLLDYGRVRLARRVPRRRRIKNLAQLNAALPDTVGAPLREAALDAYLAQSEAGDERSALRRAVIDLSLRRAHRWSGC
jgi:tRNA A-37 threonylcarbamoyl transferase component Bud32